MVANPKGIAAVITRAQAQLGIPDMEELMGKPPIGWLCPACRKGNAPDAKTCGHCAERGPRIVMNAYNAPLTGGDMTDRD